MKYLTITVCALILFCADYSLTSSQTATASPNIPATEVVQKASEVTQRARVKKKIEPQYTKDARKHNVEGTVVLRCVLQVNWRSDPHKCDSRFTGWTH